MPTTAGVKLKVRTALRSRPSRPLAIEGRSGVGKTRLLRELAADAEGWWWCSARDYVEDAVEAVRAERYSTFVSAVATDARPLVIEHIQDLRAQPRTRAELRHALLLRAAAGGTTILTLTTGRSRREIVRWLGRWADVVELARSATSPRAPLRASRR
jgi:chromosomal replication initiation ATPase DnaA